MEIIEIMHVTLIFVTTTKLIFFKYNGTSINIVTDSIMPSAPSMDQSCRHAYTVLIGHCNSLGSDSSNIYTI